MGHADRKPRGAHLVQAALDQVAEEGLDGLSIRTVAARAGVSPAQVQYYFHSKDDLLAAAFDHLSHDVEQRTAAVDTSGPPPGVLRQLLRLWLPLDETRARATRVWLAFTAAAATSPRLSPQNTALDHDLRVTFATLLRHAQANGDLDPSTDPDLEAALLLAVVDGLCLQALALPQAERTTILTDGLNTRLARLFATNATTAR